MAGAKTAVIPLDHGPSQAQGLLVIAQPELPQSKISVDDAVNQPPLIVKVSQPTIEPVATHSKQYSTPQLSAMTTAQDHLDDDDDDEREGILWRMRWVLISSLTFINMLLIGVVKVKFLLPPALDHVPIVFFIWTPLLVFFFFLYSFVAALKREAPFFSEEEQEE